MKLGLSNLFHRDASSSSSMSGNFTFPTATEYRFIVADRVNVTWDLIAPVISLYESCGNNDRILQDKVTNNYSYVWIATRQDYVESGCSFMLQPFTAEGESYGNYVTSITFGVSKRYTSDPPPVSYNFVNASSSTTASSTTLATVSTSATIAPATPTPSAEGSPGLSKAAKIGIGLGVPLGVLLFAIALGAFIIYRRRTRRAATRQIEITYQPGDGLAPLPEPMYKYPHQMRLSQAETITAPLPLTGSANYGMEGRERPLSELMSAERAELG